MGAERNQAEKSGSQDGSGDSRAVWPAGLLQSRQRPALEGCSSWSHLHQLDHLKKRAFSLQTPELRGTVFKSSDQEGREGASSVETATRGARCPPHGPGENRLLPVGPWGTRPQALASQAKHSPLLSWMGAGPWEKGWSQTLLGLQGSWHPPLPRPVLGPQAPVVLRSLTRLTLPQKQRRHRKRCPQQSRRGGEVKRPPSCRCCDGGMETNLPAGPGGFALSLALLEARSGARVCSSLKSQALKWQRKSIF